MTIDERIERLVERDEDLQARQERLQAQQDKTQILLAQIVDSIQRLERIALAHSLNFEDIEERLRELEQRREKRRLQ